MRPTSALVIAGTLCSSLLLEAQSAPSRSPSRLDVLERWVQAVEQHEPGNADRPALDVATWSQNELQRVWVDVRSVVSLIRDPGVSVFFVGLDWVPSSARLSPGAVPAALRNRRQIFYSLPELRRLRALAIDVAKRGGDNRLLKKGAMLHADIAMLEGAQEAPRASTALIDGSYAAMTLGDSDAGRNLLIIFSDGLDISSWLSSDRVLESARRSEVVVYGVSARGPEKSKFLEDLTEMTGGAIFEITSTKNLPDTFLRILAEFRERYLVSYSPRGVSADGWHRLDVRVRGRKATVKARAGYQAGR